MTQQHPLFSQSSLSSSSSSSSPPPPSRGVLPTGIRKIFKTKKNAVIFLLAILLWSSLASLDLWTTKQQDLAITYRYEYSQHGAMVAVTDDNVSTSTSTSMNTSTNTNTNTSTSTSNASTVSNRSNESASAPSIAKIAQNATLPLVSSSRAGNGSNNESALAITTSATTTTTSSNVYRVSVIMAQHRRDRMGSRVQRPFMLLAMTQFAGWSFCVPQGDDGTSQALHFPICNFNQNNKPKKVKKLRAPNQINNRTGIFQANTKDDGWVYQWVQQQEERHPGSILTSKFQETWRNMILSFKKSKNDLSDKSAGEPNMHFSSSLAQEDLFVVKEEHDNDNDNDNRSRNHTTTKFIAVHIRRGDVTGDGPVRHAYIPDWVFCELIQQLRTYVTVRGYAPQVHVFSEDYGDPNWTLYRRRYNNIPHTNDSTTTATTTAALVDYFHLAPKQQPKSNTNHSLQEVIALELNMRDWRHFVRADILVVGGTFSRIPSYARSKPSMTDNAGFPLTVWADPPNNANDGYLRDASTARARWSKTRTLGSSSPSSSSLLPQVELINLPKFVRMNMQI